MPFSDKDILKKLHGLFVEKKLTLSVVESCTGGLVSNMITDLPGASEFFHAGMITYSNDSKSSLLSVKWTTIIKDGAISEDVAKQMADGMRRLCKTNYSLAITGNLGPVAMEGKDIGLIYFAVSSSEMTFSEEMRFKGTRKKIKKQAASYGLDLLYRIASS